MRNKIFVTLMASMFSCSAALAFWPEAADSSFDLGFGYRNDSFKWETHAITTVPPSTTAVGLKSKLHWKNLNIWQIEARGKYVTCDNVYLRGVFDYGWITSGKVTDSDFISTGSISEVSSSDTSFANSFSGSNEDEFSRSHAHSKGHVYDANIAIGYQFQLCDDSLALSPVVGYGWNGQHLELKNGRQEIPASESIDDLHSKYHARWNGPFLGVDLDYRFSCDWSIFATYEFHWARYHARANWNLRSDLIDGFSQHAKNGYGNVVSLGFKWDFCECWTASLIGQWQGWYAKRGRDVAKIAEVDIGDVEVTTYVSSHLRNVRWQSGSIMFDLGMIF